jgi:tetratricopeptide (TPR) repeat protein
MNINRILSGFVVVIILHACTTTKFIEQGKTAYQEGNYASALHAFEQVIQENEHKGKPVDSALYYQAGLSAWKLGQKDQAKQYLQSADDAGYTSPQLYILLSGMYKKIDNLTLEIKALENYHQHYPNGKNIDSINIRLFETYMESEQWNKAYALWPSLNHQEDPVLLTSFFVTNRELENNAACDTLAEKLLVIDPENRVALDWEAKRYFNKADERYVSEMKAYQENHTRTQYKKLLKAWDIIWADFKKSRRLFEILYTLEPDPAYAKFLGHIYKRMDQDEKAGYWYEKAKTIE